PFESENWTGAISAVDFSSFEWSTRAWESSVGRTTLGRWKYVRGHAPGERGEFYSFNPKKSALNYIRRGFYLLEELVNREQRGRLRELHIGVLRALQNNKLLLNNVVAKVASALDVYFPKHGVAARVFRFDGPVEHRTRFEVAPIDAKALWLSKEAVFEFRATIEETAEGFLITADPSVQDRRPYEYAFYLYKNGEKLDAV